jgi:glycosyltransferase involved in cell wall biosynthesis
MLVTVAICTRNRSRLLSQALESMKALVIPPGVEWELLVVNNNSTDTTDRVIESSASFLPIRRLFEPKTGKSNALNLAVREARGEYILWTDDDCLVDPRWMVELCRAFQQWPDTAIFGGSIIPQLEGTPPRWMKAAWDRVAVVFATRNFGPEPFPISWHVMPFGANLAIRTREQRRYLYDPRIGPGAGLFIKGGEETLVVQQMLEDGIAGRWVASAKVTHLIPKDRQTIRSLRRHYLGNGGIINLRISGVPKKLYPGNQLLLETNVSVWKYALSKEWDYRVGRIFGPPDRWLEDLAMSSTAWGLLLARRKYNGATEESTLTPPASGGNPAIRGALSNDVPIFIVGAPRSGATLLAAMLGAHSRLSCGPETMAFASYPKTNGHPLYDPPSWPEKALEGLSSFYGAQNGYRTDPIFEQLGLTRDEIRKDLETRPPSIAMLLSSVAEQWMNKTGKKRWVEKSPLHLTHAYRIRKCFPQSPIIRVVRDPRDCALSQVKTSKKHLTFFEALKYWKRSDKGSSIFFEKDPLACSVRYEDLVQFPEKELARICEFIGESFEPAMLDRSQSLLLLRPKPWHLKAGEPLDTSRIRIWERELTKDQKRLAEALLGEHLIKYGYPCNRLSAAPLVYIGTPDTKSWPLGQGRMKRASQALKIIFCVAMAKLKKQEIFWSRGGDQNSPRTLSARLLYAVLAPFRADLE